MNQTTVKPHRGNAAGATDIEKAASQLASDVKYKVKQKMGAHTDMNPAQVAQAYERQLNSSPAPGPVKAIARKKLKIGVTEQYGIGELAKQSTVNALIKVFVEGVTVEEEVEDIVEADEKKYWVVVTDKKTGNTYRRQATRAKIAELRANPNIRRVEMTGYHPKETDDKQGQKTSKVKAGKGLDPVGREDADVNNNGISNDKSDKYLLKRRAAVGNAIANRTGLNNSFDLDGKVVNEAKKTKKKINDTITGEGVNNSKYINTKPTMEQSEVNLPEKPKVKKNDTVDSNQRRQLSTLQRFQDRERQLNQQKLAAQKKGQIPVGSVQMDSHQPEGDDIQEVAPPGFEGTVKAMKKYPELSRGKTPEGKEKNIYALAWFMKNKGFKSHKTKTGKDK